MVEWRVVIFLSSSRPTARLRGRTAGGLLGVAALGAIVLATVLAPTAGAAPPTRVSSGDIAADVFTNLTNRDTFVAPTTAPVFTQTGFANLTFNPPNSPPQFLLSGDTNICSNGHTVSYDSNRPFVFVHPVTCHQRIVQNATGTEQAGVADLTNFEVEFTGHISVNHAGPVTFSAFCDDQCVVGLGRNEDKKQPTGPGTGTTAKKGYSVVFTQGVGNADYVVTFPADGTYPIEVDYVECCYGPLIMTLLANGLPLATH